MIMDIFFHLTYGFYKICFIAEFTSCRAHHLDEKSLKEYGVYLPRQSSGSPQNCFIIKKMRLKQRESEDLEDEGRLIKERKYILDLTPINFKTNVTSD